MNGEGRHDIAQKIQETTKALDGVIWKMLQQRRSFKLRFSPTRTETLSCQRVASAVGVKLHSSSGENSKPELSQNTIKGLIVWKYDIGGTRGESNGKIAQRLWYLLMHV